MDFRLLLMRHTQFRRPKYWTYLNVVVCTFINHLTLICFQIIKSKKQNISEKLIKLLATQGDKTKLMENVWNIFKKCDAQLDITQSRALLELYISSNSRTDFSPKIFVEKIVANGLVPQV